MKQLSKDLKNSYNVLAAVSHNLGHTSFPIVVDMLEEGNKLNGEVRQKQFYTHLYLFWINLLEYKLTTGKEHLYQKYFDKFVDVYKEIAPKDTRKETPDVSEWTQNKG